MTRNKVPAQETTYQCQYMELPKDRDYQLIASEPFIDNANVMHHMVVRGCPGHSGMQRQKWPFWSQFQMRQKTKINIPCLHYLAAMMKKEFSDPKECGMQALTCNVPITSWSLGITGFCPGAPAAFRFGKTRFSGFLFEVLIFQWIKLKSIINVILYWFLLTQFPLFIKMNISKYTLPCWIVYCSFVKHVPAK